MPSDAELLKAYLADRDVSCVGCGYNLKGCVSQACPECGCSLQLGIGDSPRSSRWVLGLFSLAFGAGYSFWLVSYPIFRLIRFGLGPQTNPGPMVYAALLHILISLLLVIWWAHPDHRREGSVSYLWLLLALLMGAIGPAYHLVRWLSF